MTKLMELSEYILQEMMTDDSASPKFVSERLLATYESATAEQKDFMNDIFITLTGYSFGTLKDDWSEEEEEEEEE